MKRDVDDTSNLNTFIVALLILRNPRVFFLLLLFLLFMHCILYILLFYIFRQKDIFVPILLGGIKSCHSFLDPENAFLTLIPYFCKDDAVILLFHYIPSLVFI